MGKHPQSGASGRETSSDVGFRPAALSGISKQISERRERTQRQGFVMCALHAAWKKCNIAEPMCSGFWLTWYIVYSSFVPASSGAVMAFVKAEHAQGV
eukprot:799136-Amphidinium_carterae.1